MSNRLFIRLPPALLITHGQRPLVKTPDQIELATLERTAPEIAAEVKAIIANIESLNWLQAADVISRAVKAGHLVERGCVLPPVSFYQEGSFMNEVGRVLGHLPEPHVITYDGEVCFCSCHDFLLENAPFLPSGQRACKHVLALLIAESLESFDFIIDF